ncbi:MAG: hypothetical protein ACYTGC_02880 [Planctomycetota bacterium]|jgi:hypothetical protein
MTREELLELAALDAYGLLDDYESALYTRCFHHAPATVQDEILELQAELAGSTALLSDELPPADLRRRVLEAVAQAVELENSRLAPIASIGGQRPSPAYVGGEPEKRSVSRLLFGGSGGFWRAAAFVLCGAVIVLASFQIQQQRYQQLAFELMMSGRTQDGVREIIGPGFQRYVNHPDRRSRAMGPPVDPTYSGIANLMYIEPLTGGPDAAADAFVLAMGIPESDEPYTIVLVNGDGEREEISTFRSNGVVAGVELVGLTARVLATATFEILDASGAVVLTTA